MDIWHHRLAFYPFPLLADRHAQTIIGVQISLATSPPPALAPSRLYRKSASPAASYSPLLTHESTTRHLMP